MHRTLVTALDEVELTKIRDDPYVHFGDVLQLVHVDTGCVLSVDTGTKVRQREAGLVSS